LAGHGKHPRSPQELLTFIHTAFVLNLCPPPKLKAWLHKLLYPRSRRRKQS
jgi:hypothetical protein